MCRCGGGERADAQDETGDGSECLDEVERTDVASHVAILLDNLIILRQITICGLFRIV